MKDLPVAIVILGVYTGAILGAAIFDWRAGAAVALILGLAGLLFRRPPPERYRQALQNSPNAIFSVDDKGYIIIWNRSCQFLFGYPEAEMIGKDFRSLLADPADVLPVTAMLHRVFHERQAVINVDLRYRTLEGSTREMVSRFYPIFDRKKRTIECIISNTEFTERKRIEDALKESEERFRQIADNIREVFYIIDPVQDKIVYTSPAFERMWERPAHELADRPIGFLETVHRDDVENILQALRSQQDHQLEFRLMLRDGSVRWIRMRNNYVRDPAGRVTRIVGIAEDITARKQAEELVFERERMHILTNFIRDASHEFRTPLSIINTKLYLIGHSDDPAHARQLIAQINDQVNLIAQLLDSLVLMSRLDSGMTFAANPVDLNLLLNDAAAELQPVIEEHRLRLVLHLEPVMPQISGDADLLEQAFYHLVDNAVRYTPAGGQITIRTAANDNQVVVEVCDTGPGIAPADLPRIFERFYRSDQAHSTRGFGLGLPIVQKVIEGHGGTVEIESQLDQGSCFRVVLPLPVGAMPADEASL